MFIGKHLREFKRWLSGKSQTWFDRSAVLIGLIGSVITIITPVINALPEGMTNTLIANIVVFVDTNKTLLHRVAFGLWAVLAIVLISKYRTSAINKMNASSVCLDRIMGITVETVKNMEDLLENVEKQNVCPGCDMFGYARMQFMSEYVVYTQKFLDELSELMNTFINVDEPVSLCYKMVVEDKDELDKCKQNKTITIARSRNTDESRFLGKHELAVPISSNTVFSEIIKESDAGRRQSYFYVPDLKKYAKRIYEVSDGHHSYENTTQDWERCYLGTMVVPVSDNLGKGNGKREVYGFLCADSLSKNAFTLKQRSINVRLFEGYAQIYGTVAKLHHDGLFALAERQ